MTMRDELGATAMVKILDPDAIMGE
jgi:hypothetical protein